MEELFLASVLVVAGLLRVAGASRTEPWSSHTTEPSSLEEGLVTATAHLVPIREDDASLATLPFESFTSDFPNDGVSHPHEIIRTEAEVNSKDEGQPLTSPAGRPRGFELSFLDRAIFAQRSKDSSTDGPQVSKSGLLKMAAKSASQPEILTTFPPVEDKTENATGQDLKIGEQQSTLVPTTAAETGLLASLKPETLENPGQKMTMDSSPPLATGPENPHTSSLGTNMTESEVVFNETKMTPAKERLGNLLTFLPRDSQQLPVYGQTQPYLRTSVIPSPPGLLVEARLNFSPPSQQRPLSEEQVTTPQPDFASSPHEKTMRHKVVGLRTAETAAALTASQSHTHSSSLLLTSEMLSSGTPPQSAVPGGAGQRDQPSFVFRSLLPPSSTPDMPDGSEKHLQDSTPLTLQPETHHQTTIQPSHVTSSQITAAPREPLSVSRVRETMTEAPIPTQGQPQLSTMLTTDYSKARGRAPRTSPLGNTTSLHALPTMPQVAASPHIQLPLLDLPDVAGSITRDISKIPPVRAIPPFVDRPQMPLSSSAPPLTEAELFASPSASVPPKPLTPGLPATVSAGPTGLDTLPSLPAVPEDEPEELSMDTADPVPAKLPTPGSLASAGAEPRVSAAMESAHSVPRPLGLLGLVEGEPQDRALHIPFQVEHQTLGSSVSTPSGPTVPETSVPSPVEISAAAAGSDVLTTAVDDGRKPKLSPESASPVYTTRQSLPIGADAELRSAMPSVPAPGPQVPVLGVTLPTHFKSQKPGASASLRKEPQLSPTPVHARAKLNTVEAQAVGSLPVSTEANASISTHARTPFVSSVHTQSQHHLSHASSQLGAQTTAHRAQTPSTPASSPVQLLGQLRPLPSSSSIFVQTELQPQAVLTSAEAATPSPKVVTTVHPNPHLSTTLALPGMQHATAKEGEGKSSPQSSLSASQPGIHSTFPGIAAVVPSQKAEGRDQSSGTPCSSSAASQTVHRKNVTLPLLSAVLMAEHFTGVRTTPVLAEEEVQDLMQSSRGFLPHLLNQTEVKVDGNLDSAVASGYLGMLSSLQYLTFLIRGAENMICLQPVQQSSPLFGGPNLNGQGVISFQEMLISSTFLGLSHPGASNLIPASPAGVLLVKPMFVFLPADEREDPILPSAEEEEEHANMHSFSSAAVLRLIASSYEQLVESNSTVGQSPRADSLPTERQAVSGSGLSSAPGYATGSSRGRSTTVEAEPFPDRLRKVAGTTTTKALESRDQNEGSLSSVLGLPKSRENNTVSVSVEHRVSVPPPTMGSVHPRPQLLPSTSALLSPPLRITSLPSVMEQSASPMMAKASGSEEKSQLNATTMLYVEGDHPPGSMSPVTSSSKNFRELSHTSSARNVELPLAVVKNLTSRRAAVHRFLSTKVFQKRPSEIPHTASAVSDLRTFSTVKDLKESAAVDDSYSEAVLDLPRARETSFYVTNGTLAKVSTSSVFSLIPPRASERPRTPPLPTSFLSFTQVHNSLHGKHLTDMDLQVHSKPPFSISSRVSTNPYFATSSTKDHQANLMASLTRAPLRSTGGQTSATVNNETGKNVRDLEAHQPRDAAHFTPAMPGAAPALLFPTGFSSASVASGGTMGPVGFQAEIHKSPLTTFHSFSPSSAHKDTTTSSIGGRMPTSGEPHTELRSLRLSVTAATDKAVLFSPLTAEEELIQHGKGQKAKVSPPLPTSSSLEGDHRDRARVLEYRQTQDSGSSMPSPNGTSSFSESYVVTKAPAFFMTTLSSGVASNEPVDQGQHLRSPSLNASSLHIQVLQSLEGFTGTSEITANEDFMAGSTSAGEFDGSYLHTVGKQATVVTDATEAAEKGSQAVLQQSDSNSSLSDRKMHHRRPTRSDDGYLDGFAVVSDDACGSGNYTSELSLHRTPGQLPSHPDSFLALIVLQTNSSQPTLRVESCCVTPTTRPTAPDAACCLFPRTPPECRYVQPHQTGNPQAASFTIQLFQMLNHSVAYLHCELSICLSHHPGCAQNCSGDREPLSKPWGQSSYETLHNLISFGPVLKTQLAFPSELAAELELAMMFPVLLGSLAGIAILLGISIFIWFHQMHKSKMAADMEGEGLCTP